MNHPNPQPYTTELCTLCDQPWRDHLQMARTRWDEEGTETREPITVEFCITLLKVANQGPSGPPGPMGMMGASGRDAPGADDTVNHGYMTKDEFNTWLASRREQ